MTTETHIENLQHLQRIAAALAPDPREWTYDGEVSEDPSGQARCACGHQIRWIFWVVRGRDQARVPIGSTCIESSIPVLLAAGAEHLARALRQAVEELEAQRRLEEQRARAIEADAACAAVRADWQRLRETVGAIYLRPVPRSQATTPGRALPHLRRHYVEAWLAAWRRVPARWGGDIGRPPPPWPEDPVLQSLCRDATTRLSDILRDLALAVGPRGLQFANLHGEEVHP